MRGPKGLKKKTEIRVVSTARCIRRHRIMVQQDGLFERLNSYKLRIELVPRLAFFLVGFLTSLRYGFSFFGHECHSTRVPFLPLLNTIQNPPQALSAARFRWPPSMPPARTTFPR